MKDDFDKSKSTSKKFELKLEPLQKSLTPRSEFADKILDSLTELDRRSSQALQEREEDLKLLQGKMHEQKELLQSMGRFKQISGDALKTFISALNNQII